MGHPAARPARRSGPTGGGTTAQAQDSSPRFKPVNSAGRARLRPGRLQRALQGHARNTPSARPRRSAALPGRFPPIFGVGRRVPSPPCACFALGFAFMTPPFRTAGRGLPALPAAEEYECLDFMLYQWNRLPNSADARIKEGGECLRTLFSPNLSPTSRGRHPPGAPPNREASGGGAAIHRPVRAPVPRKKHFHSARAA